MSPATSPPHTPPRAPPSAPAPFTRDLPKCPEERQPLEPCAKGWQVLHDFPLLACVSTYRCDCTGLGYCPYSAALPNTASFYISPAQRPTGRERQTEKETKKKKGGEKGKMETLRGVPGDPFLTSKRKTKGKQKASMPLWRCLSVLLKPSHYLEPNAFSFPKEEEEDLKKCLNTPVP